MVTTSPGAKTSTIMAPLNKRYFLTIVFGCCIVILSYLAPVVLACQICVPYPEETLADRLLENDQIIFAREVENSPYIFYPVEVVKGSLTTEPFKQFCSSAARRKLKAIPGSAIVLVRKEKQVQWQQIAFADVDYQTFIRSLVSHGSDWPDRSNNQDRLHFFSRFLNNEHPGIHEQAYLEIGRAPYTQIKDLAQEIPKEQIYKLLHDYRLIEWYNLYILMLGQSRDPGDLAFIREKVESAARYGLTQNLSAWITSFIESHPDSGVEEVESMYFISPHRTPGEIDQVITSMSLLGSQGTSLDLINFKLRSKIVKSYQTLLLNYPETAGRVVQDLTAWQIQAHVDQISEIRKNPEQLGPSAVYSLDYYLSVAPSFRKIKLVK